jgi:hypothetical protein
MDNLLGEDEIAAIKTQKKRVEEKLSTTEVTDEKQPDIVELITAERPGFYTFPSGKQVPLKALNLTKTQMLLSLLGQLGDENCPDGSAYAFIFIDFLYQFSVGLNGEYDPAMVAVQNKGTLTEVLAKMGNIPDEYDESGTPLYSNNAIVQAFNLLLIAAQSSASANELVRQLCLTVGLDADAEDLGAIQCLRYLAKLQAYSNETTKNS